VEKNSKKAEFGPKVFRGVTLKTYYAGPRHVYLAGEASGFSVQLKVEFRGGKPAIFDATLSAPGVSVDSSDTGPNASAEGALYGARERLRALLARLDAPCSVTREETPAQLLAANAKPVEEKTETPIATGIATLPGGAPELRLPIWCRGTRGEREEIPGYEVRPRKGARAFVRLSGSSAVVREVSANRIRPRVEES
jgi:hypothetical protein